MLRIDHARYGAHASRISHLASIIIIIIIIVIVVIVIITSSGVLRILALCRAQTHKHSCILTGI